MNAKIVIGGNTIAEVEQALAMVKAGIAMGAPMGMGGSTPADVQTATKLMNEAMGACACPYDPTPKRTTAPAHKRTESELWDEVANLTRQVRELTQTNLSLEGENRKLKYDVAKLSETPAQSDERMRHIIEGYQQTIAELEDEISDLEEQSAVLEDESDRVAQILNQWEAGMLTDSDAIRAI